MDELRSNRIIVRFALVGAMLAICAGCADEAPLSTDVKPITDPLTSDDWAQFKKVVDGLGPSGLKDLPSVFAPLPDWQALRTLPVSELAASEQRLLDEHWDPKSMTPRLSQRPGLARMLRREKFTPEQFAGLILSVGAALARTQIPDGVPIDELLRRGHTVVDALKNDQRLYSSLEIEDRYAVLDQVVWLHRVDRLKRLKATPAENVALAQKHAVWLKQVLPACFLTDPLADVPDLLGEQGLPFVELPESGTDAEIDWDPLTAIGRK
jgi:hypothetical protein